MPRAAELIRSFSHGLKNSCVKSFSIPKPPASIPCAATGWSKSVASRSTIACRPDRPSMATSILSATCRRKHSPCTGCPASSWPPSRCSPEVVDEFLEFIADAPLVIHNASFDIGFINAELDRIKRQPISRDRLVDTLLLARRKHPGVSNQLDDLCSRYAIDNSRRTKHGALLDAELLAEVYIDLIGARQSQLLLASETREMRAGRTRRNAAAAARGAAGATAHRCRPRRASRLCRYLGRQADLARFSGRGLTGGRQDRFQRQLGFTPEAACAAAWRSTFWRYRPTKSTGSSIRGGNPPSRHRGRDDFARERKQQPRTFDHDQRMQVLLRHVDDAEYAGIGEIEAEHHLAGVLRLALDRKRHLEFVFGDIVGADIDLDVDRGLLRLRRQGGRRIRILERQVLGILCQHVQLGRGLPRGARRYRWSWKSLLGRASGGRILQLNSLEGPKYLCRGEWLS